MTSVSSDAFFVQPNTCSVQLSIETELNSFSIKKAQWVSEYENVHFGHGSCSSLLELCGCLQKQCLKGRDAATAAFSVDGG